ncbi:MAG: hypothetical protein AAF333_15365 [Planctomycetota bacterium]
MSRPVMRPSFWLTLGLAPERAVERFESGLARGDYPVVAQRAGLHMTVTVSPALRHFWSPWMNLEFSHHDPQAPPTDTSDVVEDAVAAASGGASTTVHARFSPAPSIWTGFMLAYVALGTLTFFALMYAAAQWMLESSPTMLWAALGFAVAWAGLWWVSWVGQRLAYDQMMLLREVLEKEFGR